MQATMNKQDMRKHNDAGHLRKLPNQKKQPITIYEVGDDITELGGLDAVRQFLRDCFTNRLLAKRKRQTAA